MMRLASWTWKYSGSIAVVVKYRGTVASERVAADAVADTASITPAAAAAAKVSARATFPDGFKRLSFNIFSLSLIPAAEDRPGSRGRRAAGAACEAGAENASATPTSMQVKSS